MSTRARLAEWSATAACARSSRLALRMALAGACAEISRLSAQRDAARLIVDAYAARPRCSCTVARRCDLCVERSQAGAP